MKNLRILLAICFMSFCAAPVLSQDLTAREPLTAPVQDLIQAASAVEPGKGEPVVVILDQVKIRFAADHRVTRLSHQIYKIIDPQKIDGWKSVKVEFAPWHQLKPQITARVIAPSGEVTPLDPETLVESGVQDRDDDVFSDRHVVQAPFPALVAGAVVEVMIRTEDSTPISAAGVQETAYMGNWVKSGQVRLVIESPVSLNLHHHAYLLPGVVPKETETSGIRTIIYDAGTMKAWEEAESNLPSDVPRLPIVRVSSANSWAEVAASYFQVVEKQVGTAELGARVTKWTVGKQSRPEKIGALIEALHAEVRYTGIEFGESAWVPHTPAETLSHKYGDCKDKSALLIAMLRTAGIPAYMALLNSGDLFDTSPDLPGLGDFNHAIVYVPGEPAYWIDATDGSARLGDLEPSIQGKLALVAAPGTTALVRIPELRSEQNRTVETREYYLPEKGDLRVKETTTGYGPVEASMRNEYTDLASKRIKESLNDYAKEVYKSTKPAKLSATSARDFRKPFELVIEVDDSKKGATELEEAWVEIPAGDILNRLPRIFIKTDEADSAKEGESNKEDEDTAKKPRKNDVEISTAFVTDWRCRVHPPLGFRSRALPKDEVHHFGPAVFEEHYSADADGTVHVDFHFDSVKNRYSLAEFKEAKAAIKTWYASKATLINFDHPGRALVQEGKFREAVDAYRGLIAQHPKEGLHHAQFANALLTLGLGDAAREEAGLAVQLDASAENYRVLATVLENDLIGRPFEPGYDPAGAEAALKKAIALEPDDLKTKAILGKLYEFDPAGDRYTSRARLTDAAAQFEAIGREKLDELGYESFLPYDYLYSGQFSKLRKWLEGAPLDLVHNSLRVAATALLDGTPAAIALAQQSKSSEKDYIQLLNEASTLLMRIRKYPESLALAQAASQSPSAPREVLARVNLLSRIRLIEAKDLDPATPQGTAYKSLFVMMSPDANVRDQDQFSSRYERDPRTQPMEDFKSDRVLQNVRTTFRKIGLPFEVFRDIMFAVVELPIVGNEKSGYRLSFKGIGNSDSDVFAYREDGKIVLLSLGKDARYVGRLAFDLVKSGDLETARQILDWTRDKNPLAGGDDPLAGRPFSRFWSVGQQPEPAAMRLAGISLLEDLRSIEDYLPEVVAAREKATAPAEQERLDLLLARAYQSLDQADKLLPIAQRLFKANPRSDSALSLLTFACNRSKQWAILESALEERAKLIPEDRVGSRIRASMYAMRGDFPKARADLKALIDSPKGTPSDSNLLTWLTLFDGSTSEDDISAARKAVSASQNDAALIHTLAVLDADRAHISEARQYLLQWIQLQSLEVPDAQSWLVVGRMADRLGLNSAAAAAYKRVVSPDPFRPLDPLDSVALARKYEAALKQ